MRPDHNFSEIELARRTDLDELFKKCPIPDAERVPNLGLFLSKVNLSRLLYLNEIYQANLRVHGSILEFGVRWGQNLALFEALRGIHEPFNANRRIIGFDTFSGFPTVAEEDGEHPSVKVGNYGVLEGYEEYLEELLTTQGGEGPLPHLKKFELVKGDVCDTVPAYVAEHPELIVSLAYFDLDLYQPTKSCLEAILPCLTKGSVLAFDEVNFQNFPGETQALKEVLGLKNCQLIHSPFSSNRAYMVYG
jgi:hypothetical protein